MPGHDRRGRSRYFRDLYDHLIRLADLVDSYRDLLASVMDTHLSTVSNRLNVVMKQLTIIATVFLPLSFLTGFFGQNFAYLVRLASRRPGPSGSSASGLEFVAVALLYVMFRRRGLAGRPDRLTSRALRRGAQRGSGRPVSPAAGARRGPRSRSTTPRSRRGPGSPTACADRRWSRTRRFSSRTSESVPGRRRTVPAGAAQIVSSRCQACGGPPSARGSRPRPRPAGRDRPRP